MKKLFLIVLAAMFVWSCTDDDDLMMINNAVGPELTSELPSEIMLTDDSANQVVHVFEWSAADFGVSTPIVYAVEIDRAGNNFANPQFLVANYMDTRFEVTHTALNSALLVEELEPGEATAMEVRVSATIGNENAPILYSSIQESSITAYRDIPSFTSDIGIIGTASPLQNWEEDVDMQPLGGGQYRLLAELNGGDLKFRKDNDWAVNWGAGDFPSGTGIQGGPDIPIPAGIYEITFNSNTGAYNFEPAGTFSVVNLVGTAVPDTADPVMFTADGVSYSTTVVLKPGELQFMREEPSTTWGGTELPEGIAVENGDPFIIEEESTYTISLNTETGEYRFESDVFIQDITIIGDAIGGWGDEDEVSMFTDDGVTYTLNTDLSAGPLKFRVRGDWSQNWGGTEDPSIDYPSGTAIAGSDKNILIPDSGNFDVTFNLQTLEYSFNKIEIESVGIIGNATPDGWEEDTDMIDMGDGVYQIVLGLTDGAAKFRTNNDWAVNWGAGDFPSGTGTQGGPDIPVTAGLYLITLNVNTGEYSFQETSVGIIGDATPGGWAEDTDMMIPDPANPGQLELSLELTDGAAKFRANNEWIHDWGDNDFPSSIAEYKGMDIPVSAGNYTVRFNVNTGEYSIE